MDDMRAVKWSKLLLNLNNPLNALSGLTLHEQLSDCAWRRLLATLQSECLEVMSAEDIDPAKLGPLPPWLIPYFLATPDWFFNRRASSCRRSRATPALRWPTISLPDAAPRSTF